MIYKYGPVNTSIGWIILSIESISKLPPIIKIIIETIIPLKYSYLSCPNGCSSSAGLLDNLKPTKVTIEAPASLKLLIPSANIDTEDEINPTIIFTEQIIKFVIIYYEKGER